MDNLPKEIITKIYEYKHEMEYLNVMNQLKVGVCYCGWCGQRQWTWTDCDCWQSRKQRGEDYDDPYPDDEWNEWNDVWNFYDEMYGIEN